MLVVGVIRLRIIFDSFSSKLYAMIKKFFDTVSIMPAQKFCFAGGK